MADESFISNPNAPKLTDAMNGWLAMGNQAIGLQRSKTALSQENLNLSKSTETYNAEVARIKSESENTQVNTDANKLHKWNDLYTGMITQSPEAKVLQQDPSNQQAAASLKTKLDSVMVDGIKAGYDPNLGAHLHDNYLGNITKGIQGYTAGQQQAVNSAQIPSTQIPTSSQYPVTPDKNGNLVQGNVPSFGGGETFPNGARPIQGSPQVAPQIGETGAVAGQQDAVFSDWKETQANAQNAKRNIGILNNIKNSKALTGTAADKLSLVDGVLDQMGLGKMVSHDLKTDLDLFNKQSAMLGGGSTDIARLTNEAANPNSHMTPEAKNEAATQRIAQEEAALKKQQFLQNSLLSVKKDQGAGYMNKLSKWNEVADPRIYQVEHMTDTELAAWKKNMSPEDQKSISDMRKKAKGYGLIQ